MVVKIPVCIEIGPQGSGVFVPDCPGCWVYGHTKESALKKVKIAIKQWFDWLEDHGESYPKASRKFEIEVTESMHVAYNPVKAGKPEPLFWSEVLPVKRDDIKRTIQLMKYSRQDLLDLVSHLTKEQLDFKPPGLPRSIRNCLKHIAYVEWWYVNRLNIEMPEKFPKDLFGLMNHVRGLVIGVLEKFPREKMRGVHQPVKYKSPTCDLWTARKVLRRLVDHERLHTRYIRKVLKKFKSSRVQRDKKSKSV
jgi:predicted RNase H-like HicB family nuclease